MHIVFLNPQGNFDRNDAYWTEHPDFGGQLVYVKEVCLALANMGNKIDIVTRYIDDPEWPEFAKEIDAYGGYEDNPRIIRIPCGGPKFLNKEDLWEHLDEYTEKIISFYGNSLPEFATAHYGDGGYSAVLLKKKVGLEYTFTGHSLGAQKLDKLGMNLKNFNEMNQQYHFSKRIVAERLSMTHAYNIITSTSQERFGQYSHPLYKGAIETKTDSRFSVIPPGINTEIFNTKQMKEEETICKNINNKMNGINKPAIVVSNRIDEKKNTIGVVKGYACSKALQKKANLCIFVRGIDDPFSEIQNLHQAEQSLLRPILDLIEQDNLGEKVFFLNIKSQQELAASYRYFANLGSVFALTSFYEPFGLAPIEAAACGLSVVATKNGGPSEIFEDGSGILVDPTNEISISEGLLKGIEKYAHYSSLALKRVKAKYTWGKTAERYLDIIQQGAKYNKNKDFPIPNLDASEHIKTYLTEKEGS